MHKTFSLLLLLGVLLILNLIFLSCELLWKEQPLGDIYAIHVALNYHGTDVNHLEGTLNDAIELQGCLDSLSTRYGRTYHAYPLHQQGGDGSNYDPPSKASVIPTKKNILSQIEALCPLLTEQDLTLFSYSGHGLLGGSLVLAPSSLEEPIILENGHVREEVILSVDELLDALSSLPGKKLLILDSCYSGSFVKEGISSVSLIEQASFLREALEVYFSAELYDPSLFVIAATTAGNTSKEPKFAAHKHGYFSLALLDGLGWDHEKLQVEKTPPAMKNRSLTVDSLYAYILNNQNFPLTGLFPSRYQHPTISGGAYTLRLF